jgi:LPS export ABC transporter protein LptC
MVCRRPLITLCFLILSAMVGACPSSAANAPANSSSSLPGSGVLLSGFSMVQDQGPRRWEIRSREAAYDGRDSAVLQEVDADLTEAGALVLTVSGTRGRYRSDTRILTLEGKVRAHTVSGYDFTAGQMEWKGNEGMVHAVGGVTLLRTNLTVRGPRLTYRTGTGTTMMDGGIAASWAAQGTGVMK